MKIKIKNLVRDWLPPAVIRRISKIKSFGIKFDGEYDSWKKASAQCHGYDAEEILTKVLESTLKVKSGEAVYERDSVTFDRVEYSWPVTAELMWVAARNKGRLNVLDFGGSLGSSYFQNVKFLTTLPEVTWNVIEQAHYVKAGQLHIQDQQLRFYETIDKCLVENKPNIILLSGVLQYLPEPKTIIESLLNIGADAIIIDLTIVNNSASDRIYIQNVPKSIYSASYPCRSLSEKILNDTLKDNYHLIEDFRSLSFSALAQIDSVYKGYIYRRNEN